MFLLQILVYIIYLMIGCSGFLDGLFNAKLIGTKGLELPQLFPGSKSGANVPNFNLDAATQGNGITLPTQEGVNKENVWGNGNLQGLDVSALNQGYGENTGHEHLAQKNVNDHQMQRLQNGGLGKLPETAPLGRTNNDPLSNLNSSPLKLSNTPEFGAEQLTPPNGILNPPFGSKDGNSLSSQGLNHQMTPNPQNNVFEQFKVSADPNNFNGFGNILPNNEKPIPDLRSLLNSAVVVHKNQLVELIGQISKLIQNLIDKGLNSLKDLVSPKGLFTFELNPEKLQAMPGNQLMEMMTKFIETINMCLNPGKTIMGSFCLPGIQ